MGGSQLEIEYDNMAERHEMYAKYGIAAEAAQLFETELGTLLLCLQALGEGWHLRPDGVASRQFLNTIDRSTLGKLLNNLKRHIEIEGDVDKSFSAALQSRNNLMHGFFERHNFGIQTKEGSKVMIAELDELHDTLFSAWQTASQFKKIMSMALQVGAGSRTDGS
ncbi:MAG: hypothetical protein AAF221_01445 [Pseudomonadota bacterium]